MTGKFEQRKATQIAGLLLKLRNQDGKMSYMKLVKLMYLVDREALLRWGFSLTGDSFVSMKHGQILSITYDLVRHSLFGKRYWYQFISEPFGDKEVRLIKEPETDELSKADVELITEVFDHFGHWDRWAVQRYTHDDLPEYVKTDGSIPTSYDRVLRLEKVPEERISRLLNDGYTLDDLKALAE